MVEVNSLRFTPCFMATGTSKDPCGKCMHGCYHKINQFIITQGSGSVYGGIVLYSTDNGILLKAFQSILSDPDFDLLSQPAIEARISASCALSWCENHQKETSNFFNCITEITDSEDMPCEYSG